MLGARGPAAHQRDVPLANASLFELGTQVRGCPGVQCKDQDSRGGAIEPMNRIKVLIELLAEHLEADFVVPGAMPGVFGRVHMHPRGLLHRDDVIVLMEDPKPLHSGVTIRATCLMIK